MFISGCMPGSRIVGSYGSFGEGNGNPLQYSCLENSVDGGARWAAVHRVPQSQTRLKQLSMHACIGEGNGNPLQYSCLENPRERGAWWASVYWVAQSRTRLKRLSSSSNSMVVLFLFFFFFWGISMLSSLVVSIYIPTNSGRGFLFLHTLSSIYCL